MEAIMMDIVRQLEEQYLAGEIAVLFDVGQEWVDYFEGTELMVA